MKRGHKLALTLAALVLIVGAGAGGYAIGNTHGKKDAKADATTTQPRDNEPETVSYPERADREEQILAVAKFYEPKTNAIDEAEYVDGFVRFAVLDEDGKPVSSMILRQQGARPWAYVTQSLEGIGKTAGEQLGLPEEFYSNSNSF